MNRSVAHAAAVVGGRVYISGGFNGVALGGLWGLRVPPDPCQALPGPPACNRSGGACAWCRGGCMAAEAAERYGGLWGLWGVGGLWGLWGAMGCWGAMGGYEGYKGGCGGAAGAMWGCRVGWGAMGYDGGYRGAIGGSGVWGGYGELWGL